MTKEFYTDIVGRHIEPIPIGTTHFNEELPFHGVYQIHTVYLEDGVPTALGYLARNRDPQTPRPFSVKVRIEHIGILWRFTV